MRTRSRLRKILTAWVASYLVALTSVIGVMSPMPSTAADIGLSVTCHSERGGAEQAPSPSPHLKCDHCAVCSFAPALALPSVPAQTIRRMAISTWLGAAYAALASFSNQTAAHQARAPPRHA